MRLPGSFVSLFLQSRQKPLVRFACCIYPSPITLVKTQNVSVTKIVVSSSIQRAETKYGLRIQFLVLVVMIHEVWLNA